MLSGPAAGAEASGVRQEVGGGQHNDRRGLDVLKKLARDIMSAVGKRLGSYCYYSDIAHRGNAAEGLDAASRCRGERGSSRGEGGEEERPGRLRRYDAGHRRSAIVINYQQDGNRVADVKRRRDEHVVGAVPMAPGVSQKKMARDTRAAEPMAKPLPAVVLPEALERPLPQRAARLASMVRPMAKVESRPRAAIATPVSAGM